MKITKAVILAGGLGTRMRPMTNFLAKEMMPIYDKPLLEHLINDLTNVGIKEILIISHRNKTCIQNYFKNKKAMLSFVYPNRPNGVVDALLHSKSFVGNDNFVLLYGDVLFDAKKSSVFQMVEAFSKANKSVVATRRVDFSKLSLYGVVEYEKNGDDYYIKNIIEKPTKNFCSNMVVAGQFILTPNIFDELQKLSKKELFTDALNKLSTKNQLIMKEIDGRFFDIGNKLGFVLANINYGLKQKKSKEEIKKFLFNLVK